MNIGNASADDDRGRCVGCRPGGRGIVFRLCLLALLFYLASSVAGRGIQWSTCFHPDELPIARWIDKSIDNGYIGERVYPSGWFVLIGISEWWNGFREKHLPNGAAWRSQDGRVVAVREETFKRPVEKDDRLDLMQRGRDFNVFLLALSSVLLYLALLRIGCSPPAAFFSGLLLAFHPFFIEHAHYCETDMALVVSLAAYALAASFAIEKRSAAAALAAAFMAGFGVASKYTLAPILAVAIALIVAATRKYDRRRAALTVILVVTGIVFFALGFIWGTPAIYKNPSFYLHGASSVGDGTYSKAAGLSSLGGFLAKIMQRSAALARESWKAGWPMLAWSLASLGFWFEERRKRHLAGFPLFLPVFLVFALLFMPWIRNQELLPVLVVLVFSAALPLDHAIKSFHRGMAPRQAILPCVTVAIAMLVLASVARDGLRMSSAFLHRETRAECQNWLFATAPSGTSVASSHYVGQAARGVPVSVIAVGQLEEWYFPGWTRDRCPGNPPPYYLRDSSFLARDNRTAILNRLDGKARSCLESFNRDALPLKSWAIAPGRVRPIFSQHDVELWALPADDGGSNADMLAPDIPVLAPRPVFFRWAGATYYASWELGPIGPEEAIQTVGKRRWVRPFHETEGKVWAVSRSVGGRSPVTVCWDGLFTPSSQTFALGHAAVFECQASEWRRMSLSDAIPGARIRMRGDDQENICLTTIVSNPAEAAFLLRSHGEAERALELLKNSGIDTDESRVQAFLAAREAKSTPEDDWAEAAHRAVATYDSTIGVGGAARICGIPSRIACDFARIRLEVGCYENAETPVFLPGGRYTFTVAMHDGEPIDIPRRFFAGITNTPYVEKHDDEGGTTLESSFAIPRGKRLRLSNDFPEAPEAPDNALIEISWNPLDFLAREIENLRSARPDNR